MKQSNLNLESDKISLRILRLSDFWSVYKNIRNEEVGKWTGPDTHLMPKSTLIQFLCRLLRHLQKGLRFLLETLCPSKTQKVFRLGIVFRETQKVVGIVTLSRSESEYQCAEVGFWIGKKYWGCGLTTEALKLSIEFGFNTLALEKIVAWTFEKNVGSKKVLEKCGFKLDSVVEAAYLKYNEIQNRLNYRILKSEYKSVC
jgi:ribosomal-protein-alanine N-acetyltransferase